MTTITDELAASELLGDLDPAVLAVLADCAQRRTFQADEVILVPGEPADVFHLISSGLVAVAVPTPPHGSLLIDTIGPGEVLGMSWLLPPYRWTFGARAVEATATIAVDAEAVRTRCDAEPAFGYQLYRRFSAVVHDRLVSARVRLLDLYATGTRP